MFQLKLLGAPAIWRDGARFTGRATQRHRLALLALLAAAHGRRLTRDKLLGLLWPESDEERGRNLLKTSTYVIRTELGESAVLTTGDEVQLNTQEVGCDVADFEAAFERRDFAQAASLYSGPFLDGFFLSDAPGFDQWLEHERTRLAGLYRNALEALAAAAEQAGESGTAVDWWKQRAAQDPYDSRVAQRLMSALDASGNRAGALQHAGIHERMLQEEFGVAPPADFAAFVERLRLQPAAPAKPAAPATVISKYQPVSEEFDVATPDFDKQSKPEPYAPKAPPRWPALAAVLLIIAIGSAIWAFCARPDPAATSIVVLPFVNYSGDADNEVFSDGLTEEIITRLASVPGLKVISRTSAMYYKGAKKPLPEIARELRVDHILEGSVRREQGEVRVSAQLIDARADQHLWANNYQHKLVDSFRVQEEIATEVASALQLRLARRTRRLLEKRGTADAVAYQLYQRARFQWNMRTRDGHTRAIDYYGQAIARDSSYADAYAGIAHVYLTAYQLNLLEVPEAEAYRRVQAATERALALDDESAEAHVAAAIAFKWQHNWPDAEREYLRAIELNPGHAIAHSWYSLLLRGLNRPQDALRESQLAAELDPFGVVTNHNYAWQFYLNRNYARAIDQFNRTLEIAPYPSAIRWLGVTYTQQGNTADGLAMVRSAIAAAPERPEFFADLAYVHARAGQTDSAHALLQRAKLDVFEPYNIARAHIALHQPDSAFVWLARANWHWPNRAPLDDPALDPVRSDIRFRQLVQRIHRDVGLQ